MTDSTPRGEALTDLLPTNTLIEDVKTGGSLSCSGHALVEFTILRDIGQVKNRVRALNFRKANFQLFKELMDGAPGKLPSGTKELNRTGSSLTTFFLECKSSQYPHVRNQQGMQETNMAN